MMTTVRRHAKYCNDVMPAGLLCKHALKCGQQSQHFWQHLLAYIKDEFILLMSFNLPEKHICLLMSHLFRYVTTCLSIVVPWEYRHTTATMGPANSESASHNAWVTLHSLTCMDGYLKACFWCLQGINTTFMHFLM
jgi:hypothetical protein